jgi:CIC family chloride channel protein
MKRVVGRELLTTILKEAAPADLRIVGRMLLHAAIVGVAAGLMGAAFFAALELVQRLILEDLGGYRPLRAHGETFLPEITNLGHFRPWLLALVPAVGALASGIISELAPETRGGGGDAMINAFHRQDGIVRKRVAWVKGLASIFTLSTGGFGRPRGARPCRSAARWVDVRLAAGRRRARAAHPDGVGRRGRHLRRVPHAAGRRAAGGRGAVPRRLRADALIPGGPRQRRRLLGRHHDLRRDDDVRDPGTLPVRHQAAAAVRAAGAAGVGAGGDVLSSLRTVQRVTASLTIPRWARPAWAGLAMGVFCVPIIWVVGASLAQPGQGLGLLGGGYGAVQIRDQRHRMAARRVGGVGLLAGCAWPRSSRRRSPSVRAAAPATSPRRW